MTFLFCFSWGTPEIETSQETETVMSGWVTQMCEKRLWLHWHRLSWQFSFSNCYSVFRAYYWYRYCYCDWNGFSAEEVLAVNCRPVHAYAPLFKKKRILGFHPLKKNRFYASTYISKHSQTSLQFLVIKRYIDLTTLNHCKQKLAQTSLRPKLFYMPNPFQTKTAPTIPHS